MTIEQATSEIVALSERLEADAPANAIRGLVPVVRAFANVVVGDVRTPMLALFGAVGLVLPIASANVANLLLMRAEARRGELALRAALGAGRSRILSQVLIESLVVAGLAGVAGVAITWWSLQALITLVPDGLPRAESVRIDTTVVSFSIGVVLVTAFLAGLAPALLSMRADLGVAVANRHPWNYPLHGQPRTPDTRCRPGCPCRDGSRRRRPLDSERSQVAVGRTRPAGRPPGASRSPHVASDVCGQTSACAVSR